MAYNPQTTGSERSAEDWEWTIDTVRAQASAWGAESEADFLDTMRRIWDDLQTPETAEEQRTRQIAECEAEKAVREQQVTDLEAKIASLRR